MTICQPVVLFNYQNQNLCNKDNNRRHFSVIINYHTLLWSQKQQQENLIPLCWSDLFNESADKAREDSKKLKIYGKMNKHKFFG